MKTISVNCQFSDKQMFIATQIASNWWMFLVVGGLLMFKTAPLLNLLSKAIVCGCCCCVCIFECCQKSDDVVQQNSFLIIFARLIVHQFLFYLIYLFIIYALNTISSQLFFYTQIWSAYDFGFTTARGVLNMVGLAFAIVAMAPAITANRGVCHWFCQFFLTRLAEC